VFGSDRLFVKICGITNEDDAMLAFGLGADAVGFVFAPSSRQVTAGTVRDITRRLHPDILTVGVFRDQSPQFVIDTVQAAGLQAAQLHGHETPHDAAEIRPYVQALIVGFAAGDPGLRHVDAYGADAVLLDSPAPGSGQVFDWSLADGAPSGRRIILAGGLSPENVADGVVKVNPWGVDVSSGVEVDGDPGRKDPRKVQAFIRNARAAVPVLRPSPGGVAPFDWAESGI
jgi:phosphoribosylanthranilate isomerase